MSDTAKSATEASAASAAALGMYFLTSAQIIEGIISLFIAFLLFLAYEKYGFDNIELDEDEIEDTVDETTDSTTNMYQDSVITD